MNKYTIYCTEAQTRKALELGAPIEYGKYYHGNAEILHKGKDGRYELYSIPTAEQMIGWLEEQGEIIDVAPYSNYKGWCFYINGEFYLTDNISRKEATLAAIDAALEYLTNKQNKQ